MRVRAPLVVVAGAILLRLGISVGFANYDTLYSLAWGQQIARGQNPELPARISPRRHTRCSRRSASCSPRSGAKATLAIVVALAYLSLAALGYVVFVLGSRWFSWPVGLAAAAFVLSRYEVLSYGVRAYADLPYVVLVLAALAIESRRRRAGLPVLAAARARRPAAPGGMALRRRLLVLPVAGADPARARTARLAVAAAPALWVISDAAITGHPLWSLTNTRATAKTLKRPTGSSTSRTTARAAGRGAGTRRPRRRGDRRDPVAVARARARDAGRGGGHTGRRRAGDRRRRGAPDPGPLRVSGSGDPDRLRRRRARRLARTPGRARPPAAVAGGVGAGRDRGARVACRGSPALPQDVLLRGAGRPVALRAAADRERPDQPRRPQSARAAGASRCPTRHRCRCSRSSCTRRRARSSSRGSPAARS